MKIDSSKLNILAIDTSCDETSAAVTSNLAILSNIIWSQASLHANWGGVVPSLAKREHEKRIDWVINKAIQNSRLKIQNLGAVAVTVGPGLAIALEVGIRKAKELSEKFNKPLIPINHIEGHLLSPLAKPKAENSKFQIQNSKLVFPALGLVTSGGHTEIIFIKEIGKYHIIAETLDDALGESLDKAARLLGFGYPGGAVLEKIAKQGNFKTYNLPIPMLGREKELTLSYSGLKTAFFRLIKDKDITKKGISDLAASYQYIAFTHFVRVLDYILRANKYSKIKNIFAGGGVMSNALFRKMLRKNSKKYGVNILFPYSRKLYTDNAAMIGIAAYFKLKRGGIINLKSIDKIDRVPGAKIDKPFVWKSIY
ncbi:tRNA (adenosine(37)-N6)-threonylcarbamoyltransferase complex transferase subunit TsaD [Candidatus Woesebacteria bacterium RBG_13_34_9]|uniref:tRNA N6-adenosine threonylcarbamoyltransferase n=1 Tax=Candidatus Woesebacteria bacterium RBG_13_34_9 TaxID=1802477 RepID=A0A1F7X5L0_9BACT|nr:MAG: tRNA (adenosine(37)-N6)-threonylcarbamoyltransferase complex transferase subunit TsaD [Candidatus Woesebacteria bacterium RBG_13_34_9]